MFVHFGSRAIKEGVYLFGLISNIKYVSQKLLTAPLNPEIKSKDFIYNKIYDIKNIRFFTSFLKLSSPLSYADAMLHIWLWDTVIASKKYN
jgi:hypothetical protein